MKLNPALSLVVCMLLTSSALSADKDELQGSWVVQLVEIMGKSDDTNQDIMYEFSGGKYMVRKKGDKKKGNRSRAFG